ncbi:CaiB/BaiF CoA transferase family protein [Bosea minatitlanensis]|jgi:crotonobetainyl-CoA:carnitine CoA-transferase CaiB-like acyl-CoA transferase|uniref:CaiB/BaiF CoA transferase family protein n=1 Tax=Bosea minatitlanensis TaxID=128782 RepID=A0ABW0F399_9HYPH|nr:CoA transferase [Bosea minatitlanensis]MCT4493976.1 CoA transferase [Bosea minatitlanensis]
MSGWLSAADRGTAMPGMLDGVRVVDLGTVITGPLAGQMLGDLGADVIKVEPPGGDPFRRTDGSDYGPTFLAYNRNKRSVILDLAQDHDRAALLALVETADVLLDNYRPGVLAKVGLAPDELRRRNPRLVQCSITGFGDTGPYRRRPAFDGIAQALSGIAGLMIDPDEPLAFGPTISDNVTGMYACYAILAALIERGRTGAGRRLEVNMIEASMAFIPDAYANAAASGRQPDRFSRVAVSQSFVFRCADGLALAIHLSTREKFWEGLVTAIGAPELAADARFDRHLDRVRNYVELQRELALRFAVRPRGQWSDILGATDVPFAPVLSLSDVLVDPQIEALRSATTLHHRERGAVPAIHCPILVDGARPISAMKAPPTPGEHNDDVLGRADFKFGKEGGQNT